MKKIHFIGIGGIGMSALASIMMQKGSIVSGSDKEASESTNKLNGHGAKIFVGHNSENISADTQLIVYSEAIPKDNPEMQKADSLKIKKLSYAEALGQIANQHQLVLVAGTHGKTTTTGMIAKIALENDLEPTIVIGGKMKELGGDNFRAGKSDLWIVEGCEYRRSFLNFEPNILAITNVDVDHLDYYKDEDDYLQAFIDLIKNIKQGGKLIINKEDKRSLQATELALKDRGDIEVHYTENERLTLSVPGKHNQLNAQIASETAKQLNLSDEDIMVSLMKFNGTWRRLELVGTIGKTKIYDDYAHHPVEIKATLQALREIYPTEKICCVFQPHQFNRTKHFLNEFATSFSQADTVIIPDIYQVRDLQQDLEGLSDKIFVETISQHHSDVRLGEGLNHTADVLKKEASGWDVIVLMGAGDIAKLRSITE